MRIAPVMVFAAALVACTSTAPRYEADPNADLVALKRFGWHAAPRAPVTPMDSEILRKRTQAAIGVTLVGNGYAFDEATPQFRIRSHLLVEQGAKKAPQVSFGLGTGSYGGSFGSSVSVGGSTKVGKDQDAYTLVIELRDARDDALLWQGWREVRASVADAANPELDAAVRAILADFPVPAGAKKKNR